MTKKTLLIIVSVVVLIVLGGLSFLDFRNGAAPQPSADDNLRHLRLQLKWTDQAQFGGFYAARYFDYYKHQGLDVDIVPGSAQVSALQQLETGRAELAIVDADQALTEFAHGAQLKVIGAVFNRSAVCFMVKASSKIKTPADFRGRTVGVFHGLDTEHVLYSLLQKEGVAASDVKIVRAGPIEAFRTGEMDVFPAYTFNEPLTMSDEGVPTRCILPDDFGIYYYSDVIVTTTAFFNANKDAVVAFLRASAQGWTIAEQDPEHVVATMIAHIPSFSAHDDSTYKHQLAMLKTLLRNLRGGNDNVMFFMDRARWTSMEQSLVSIGAMDSPGKIDDLVDFQISKTLQ